MIKNLTITRQCMAVIILALCLLFAISYPGNASSITLKNEAVIADNSLKLGDIFHGLPHSADRVLGPAPRPGHDMVLNARTLLRIAIALDLPWKPQSSEDFVTVKRAATLVERAAIEEQLKVKLQEAGLSGSFNLTLPTESAEIILPASEAATFDIKDLKINRKNNWFEAKIIAPSEDNPIHRSRISGTYEMLAKVPVLLSPMRGGSIISERDIQMIEIPERYLGSDIIVNASNLVGTTPRTMIIAGKPVKAHQIEEPKIIQRGEMVTVKFKHGALQLTTRAKALQNGARGDTISVVNINSNKTLEGIVTASKEVTVQTF